MSENNIPEVTVSGLVQELGDLYTKAIQGGWPLTMLPTPFVWGPPGVGKSDGAKQLKVYIEKHTSKKVVVTDVRLLLFSPIDLRGIPVANQEKTFAEWLKPKIFDMDSSEDVINILFLDELTAAPPAVQAAAYQLTLDRRIGEHELPDNCLVIGAGNRTTDHSVAYRMPNALANRMQHYEVCPDLTAGVNGRCRMRYIRLFWVFWHLITVNFMTARQMRTDWPMQHREAGCLSVISLIFSGRSRTFPSCTLKSAAASERMRRWPLLPGAGIMRNFRMFGISSAGDGRNSL